MSVEWWSWGWKNGPPDPDHRYVWLALANHADKAGDCFPSIPRLVEETRLSESTVRRALNALVADGWVVRTMRGNGRGKLTHYQLVMNKQRVSDRDPLPSEAETLKGRPADSHSESQGPEKGVTLTKPPHPHIGVTVNEPSEGNVRGNRHARGARLAPAPYTDAGLTGELYSDEEESAASKIFWKLQAPANKSLISLAAQAIHFEAERLGSIEAAEASILKAAQVAQNRGAVKSWQFWLEDGQYRQPFSCTRV